VRARQLELGVDLTVRLVVMSIGLVPALPLVHEKNKAACGTDGGVTVTVGVGVGVAVARDANLSVGRESDGEWRLG
jgi:hypothetical protein